MTLYSNVTDGPVVIDPEGRILPGLEVAELTVTDQVAAAVEAGRLVDLDALRGDTKPSSAAAPPTPTVPSPGVPSEKEAS